MKRIAVPFIFFILSFYCFGLGVMDSFVVYHSWLYADAGEFVAMHTSVGKRIVILFVLPTLLLTFLCILMFWKRPSQISKTQVWLAFTMLLTGWLSSVFIQIPIQSQLSVGKDDGLLRKLIGTDWIRVVAWMVYIVIVLKMLWQITRVYKTDPQLRQNR